MGSLFKYYNKKNINKKISPLIVYVKVLFQEVCKAKIDWDEEFTGETRRKWEVWCRDLVEVNEVL